MFCSKCGKEINDDAAVCIHCGRAVTTEGIPVVDDKVSVGFCVLSAFIPLFGLIYWAVNSKTKPKAAKACGVTALISWGCCFLLSMTFGCVAAIATSL